MKKFLIVTLGIILIASACNKQSVYQNNDYGFEIKYSSPIKLITDRNQMHNLGFIPLCESGEDKLTLACLYYPRESFKGTDFEGAALSISLVNGVAANYDCFANLKQQQGKKDINGQSFVYSNVGEAATGHSSQDKVYQTFTSKGCFNILLRVDREEANSSVEKLSPNDQAKISNTLDQMLATLKFTN